MNKQNQEDTTNFGDESAVPQIKEVLYMNEIESMNPKEYQKWIYSQDCRANKVQIFRSEFYDRIFTQMCSPAHFVVWLAAWLIVILTLLPTHNIGNWIFATFIGYYFLSKKVELVLHKYVFHMKVRYNFQKYIHFLFHGLHHAAPKDLTYLMLPLLAGIPIAFIVRYILLLFTAYNYDLTNSLMAGILIGYVKYDIIHYSLHAFSKSEISGLVEQYTFSILPDKFVNSFVIKFESLKKNHNVHHYKNHNKHFEVSYLIE